MRDESELVREAQRGNSQSFGELVRVHQDRLYNSMVHVLGCPEDAYDIVQDTFVQALLKITTFNGQSKFYTWIYRIAFNRAMTKQRRQRPAISVEQSREGSGWDLPDPEGLHRSATGTMQRWFTRDGTCLGWIPRICTGLRRVYITAGSK